jgi:hypothetical protein
LRHTRRLIFVVVWLALFDQFVPVLQRRLEYQRYERREVTRFENSDLFPLGPLVAYLREHPHSSKPRVGFFGSSVIWGYGAPASDAVPARFQEFVPNVKVLNLAVNGFRLGSGYLIAKAVLGSVDRLYIQVQGGGANPLLPSLIPVDEADRIELELPAPNNIEKQLEAVASSWRLYGATYRLQAALFGTSTIQYLYLNKGRWARSFIEYVRPSRGILAAPVEIPGLLSAQESLPEAQIIVPRAEVPPGVTRRDELRRQYPLLWKFEEMARSNKTRMTFLLLGPAIDDRSNRDFADLNATFAPFAEVLNVRYPASLAYDGVHLSDGGARRVAEALARYDQAAQ